MKRKMTLSELPEIAKSVLDIAQKSKSDKAAVIALSGELGSGKTTLTQRLAERLGIKEQIISPTFVIMKRYELLNQGFKNLVHIDAYRLKDKNEILTLGWEDIVSDSGNLIVIEWPENVSEVIPDDAIKIHLVHKDENVREMEML